MAHLIRTKNSESRWLGVGVGYTLLLMLVGGYLNYTQPYDANPVISPSIYQVLLWVMCYVPLFIFPMLAKWEINELGFSITPISLVVSAFFAVLCGALLIKLTTSWIGAVAEAFGRTGEEVFFRGFLFLLLLRIFTKRRWPWLWTAIGSALLFTLVHTQTFQPDYYITYSTGSVAFTILQRLLNLFLVGIALALLRYWTKSILPGSIVHSVLQGGPLTLPFAVLIYGAIIGWASIKKEKVFLGFARN